MDIFKLLKNIGLSNKGTSIVELTLVAGILSFVAMGTAFTIQQNVADTKRAEKKADLLNASSLLQVSLNHLTSATGGCTDVIQLPSGSSFSPNSKTNVRLSIFGDNFEAGYTAPDGSFRVEELYIDNAQLLGLTATDASYTASVYMVASVRKQGANTDDNDPNNDHWARLPLQKLTSLSAKFSSSGSLLECSSISLSVTSRAVCETVEGMFWSEANNACYEVIERDGDFLFPECHGNDRDSSGCHPDTDCVYQQLLPQGFRNGDVEDCNTLPPGYQVVHVNQNLQPADQGEPLPPPKCSCGSTVINQGQYCVTCLKDDNEHGFMNLESYYYYTVFECVVNTTPSNGDSGQLSQIMGNYQNGTFRDSSDPPSGYGCSMSKKKGVKSGYKYYQLN